MTRPMSRKSFMALAEELGVSIEGGKEPDGAVELLAIAPDKKRFKRSETHTAALGSSTGEKPNYKFMAEEISDLEQCPAPGCEWCNS